jgi:CSLREA domain-containing protein
MRVRSKPIIRAAGLSVLAAAALALPAGASANASITVTTTQDDFANGTDSTCSLREAVQAANADQAFGGCPAGSGVDTILVTGAQLYHVDRGGPAEDQNAAGDFDIRSPVAIAATGEGNARISGGGFDRVFQIFNTGSLTGTHLDITDGNALSMQPTGDNAGGGILDAGTLVLHDSIVRLNRTTSDTGCSCGGGIAVEGKANLEDTQVTQNSSSNIGGGIQVLNGQLRTKFATVSANTTDFLGAGIDIGIDTAGSVSLTDSTIDTNTQTSDAINSGGGGIAVQNHVAADLEGKNLTIANNLAGGWGGGVYAASGAFALESSTVAGNTANTMAQPLIGGGGIAGGELSIRNSIVALNDDRNPAPDNGLQDCALSATPTQSLVGKRTGCPRTANIVTTDPKLGSLKFKRGIVRTVPLQPKSPAIGAAHRPTPGHDERGVKRDRHPDLGAFELNRLDRRGR